MIPFSARIRPADFFGWRILALATLTAVMTGPGQTSGVSVFVDPLITDLQLTRPEVSAAYLIGTLVGAALLLPVSRWIDQVGARRAMLLIGLAFGAGVLAMSAVQGFVTLAIGFVLIRWLGQGSLFLVSTLSITPWFERRRGLAFGISTTAVSILLALMPIALGVIIGAIGWRFAWVLAALAVWLIVLPIARFGIIDRPSDVGQYPDGAAAPTALERQVPVAPSTSRREAIGQRRFWLLSLGAVATSMLGTALNFHQISMLVSVGLSATEAAAMFLPQVIGAVIAGLLMGAVADRVAARYLMAVSMVLLAVSLLLVPFIAPGWQVFVYAVSLGAAGGAQRPLVSTILPRWYGLGHIGAIQGVAAFLGVAASATGPVALSLVSEWLGSYGTAALVLAAIPMFIAVASLGISEPAPRVAVAAPPPVPTPPD